MNFLPTLKRVFISVVLTTIFISAPALAGDPLITRHFSGVWDQPEQESQGMIIQIGEQDGDQKIGIAYWFTYGDDLQTSWYIGVGPVNGNEINMNLYTAFNVAFMADNLEGDANVELVGTLDLVFQNCNHGTATFETPDDVIGSGEFPIKRLISIYRTRCSGGISDDTPADGKPLKLEVDLHPAAEDGTGSGKAKFWERSDRSDFKVEAEGLPDGDYALTLQVCDEPRGEMPISGGEGELVFRSPGNDSALLLDFDPRDCPIELLDIDTVVLTSGEAVLGEKEKGPSAHGDESGVKLEAEFSNTGVIEDARGEAEFETEGDESEFSVKIKDVPEGFYAVVVGGVEVGEIEVVDIDGKLEGRIKFTMPQRANTLELNFDPRGEVIEILQDDDQVILEALFPDE